MVAWSAEQRDALPGIEATARENGYAEARPVDVEELYAREPNTRARARRARSRSRARGSSARSPTTLASPPRRVAAGCELVLNAAVSGVRPSGGGHELETARGPIRGAVPGQRRRACAATRSTRCSATPDFRVTPRRGELIVFDKLARGLLNHVLLPVPTEKTKGVLVSPTIYGNVLLGPTADDIDDKTRPLDHRGRPRLADGGRRPDPARARATTR